MKVKLLRNPAAGMGCQLCEGEIGDVSGDIGRKLVKSGIAICLDPPPDPIKAIPAKPAIAEAKPAAIRPTAKTQPKRQPQRQTVKPTSKENLNG